MNKTNDELILSLIKAKKEGLKIIYGDTPSVKTIKENHAWDLATNTYTVIRPREYIICIPTKGGKPIIEEVTNTWTRSDFGKTAGGKYYILMREVFQEDM